MTLAADLTADLASFFDADEFAVTATYDGSTSINVIHDAEFLSALGVAGSNPVALVMASSVAAAPQGKTLLIGAITYKIRNIEPQGSGETALLQLEKQ